MNGDCNCHIAYRCSSCGHCLAHDHSKFSVPASTFPNGVQWFWNCPGGGIRPCYPEPETPEPKMGPIPQSKSQAKRFEIQQRGKKRR